jgi:hypothetical protein
VLGAVERGNEKRKIVQCIAVMRTLAARFHIPSKFYLGVKPIPMQYIASASLITPLNYGSRVLGALKSAQSRQYSPVLFYFQARG